MKCIIMWCMLFITEKKQYVKIFNKSEPQDRELQNIEVFPMNYLIYSSLIFAFYWTSNPEQISISILIPDLVFYLLYMEFSPQCRGFGGFGKHVITFGANMSPYVHILYVICAFYASLHKNKMF